MRAGYLDSQYSIHEAASLTAVSSIALFSKKGSSNIDAIVVGFVNNVRNTMGSPDAALVGTKVASVSFMPGDRVEALYIWTNSSTVTVKGVLMVLTSGAELQGGQGGQPTQATLRLDKPGQLGTGLLIGVAGAVKPGTEVLSAISFVFMQPPMSSAVAVDMPKISIEDVVFKPVVVGRSSTTVSGNGSITKAFCPSFSRTVTVKRAYSRASEAQRLVALVASLGTASPSQQYRLDAALVATARQAVNADVATIQWNDQVGERDQRAVAIAPLDCVANKHAHCAPGATMLRSNCRSTTSSLTATC
jgi:hypothetical protein